MKSFQEIPSLYLKLVLLAAVFTGSQHTTNVEGSAVPSHSHNQDAISSYEVGDEDDGAGTSAGVNGGKQIHMPSHSNDNPVTRYNSSTDDATSIESPEIRVSSKRWRRDAPKKNLEVSKATVSKPAEGDAGCEEEYQDSKADMKKTIVTAALNKLATAVKNATGGGADGESDTTTPLPLCSTLKNGSAIPASASDGKDPAHKRSRRSGSAAQSPLTRLAYARLKVVELEEDTNSTGGGLLEMGQVQPDGDKLEESTEDESSEDEAETSTTETSSPDPEGSGKRDPSKGPVDSRKPANGQPSPAKGNSEGGQRSNSTKAGPGTQRTPNPGKKEKAELVSPTLLTPKNKPGKCQSLTGNQGCLLLGEDSTQCTKDGDCPGTRKCCFYGCSPYNKVGVCEVPTLF